MADAVTGTNTEKIDALLQQVADLKAQLRMLLWLFGLFMPPTLTALMYMAMQLATLTAEARSMTGRLDRMDQTLAAQQKDMLDLRDRMIRMENQKK